MITRTPAVAVVDLAPLLRERDEPMAVLAAARRSSREHERLRRVVDHQRAVAAAAPRAGLQRALARSLGESASICCSPATARRQAPSQSASSAESGASSSRTYAVRRGLRVDDGLLPAWRRGRHPRRRPAAGSRAPPGPARRRCSARASRGSWRRASRPSGSLVLAPTPSARRRAAARLERRARARLRAAARADPGRLARRAARAAPSSAADELDAPTLSRGDRLAMLSSGSTSCRSATTTSAAASTPLLGGFIRRIDRLKAELISAEEYAALGARRCRRAVDAAPSASSPRSTARTSGCSAEAGARRRRPGPRRAARSSAPPEPRIASSTC